MITPPRSCRPLRYHMRVPWKLSTQDVDHATAVTDTVVMPTQKQQRALTQSTRRPEPIAAIHPPHARDSLTLVSRLAILKVQGPAMLPRDCPEQPSGTPRWFSLCYRTTSTEQVAYSATLVDTLPRRIRAMPPSPLAPITIRSACCLEATCMIAFAGFPS